ncbi:hypothetical protein KFU94_00685 [Chloroflexi bacterium TSY]|nr:hypothetical protein [Chloroflexi bacterium TSY]
MTDSNLLHLLGGVWGQHAPDVVAHVGAGEDAREAVAGGGVHDVAVELLADDGGGDVDLLVFAADLFEAVAQFVCDGGSVKQHGDFVDDEHDGVLALVDAVDALATDGVAVEGGFENLIFLAEDLTAQEHLLERQEAVGERLLARVGMGVAQDQFQVAGSVLHHALGEQVAEEAGFAPLAGAADDGGAKLLQLCVDRLLLRVEAEQDASVAGECVFSVENLKGWGDPLFVAWLGGGFVCWGVGVVAVAEPDGVGHVGVGALAVVVEGVDLRGQGGPRGRVDGLKRNGHLVVDGAGELGFFPGVGGLGVRQFVLGAHRFGF